MLSRFSRIVSSMHYVLWIFPEQAIVQRTASNPFLTALLPVQEQGHPMPGDVNIPAFCEQLVRRISPARGDKWHIGLPLEYFSVVNFSLPQAAEDNLDQAVRYALMRHVPFELGQTYTDYTAQEGNGQLHIAAVVAQKEEVDPILGVFAQARQTVRSLFPSLVRWALVAGDGAYLVHGREHTEIVLQQEGRIPFQLWFRPSEQQGEEDFVRRGRTLLENMPDKPDTLYLGGEQESWSSALQPLLSVFSKTERRDRLPALKPRFLRRQPYTLNMLTAAARQQEQLVTSLRIGAGIFLLLSLLSFPAADLLGSMRYADRIQNKIETVQEQVRELDAIRQENQELRAFFDSLAQIVQASPQSAVILKEMTEVLPKTAWLYSFQFSDGKVSIQGEGESATAVLEALENSPLFENVQFDSPVQKSGSRDRFKIVAQVVM